MFEVQINNVDRWLVTVACCSLEGEGRGRKRSGTSPHTHKRRGDREEKENFSEWKGENEREQLKKCGDRDQC